MKKVFLLCYVNMNLGDDLFLKIIIERYPNTLFYIFGNPAYLDYYRQYKNTRIMTKLSYLCLMFFKKYFFKVYKKLFERKTEKFDAVVKIGGSIFQEDVNKIDLKIINNNYFIIGSNYGPEKTLEYREKVFKELGNVVDCCFRDMYSYSLFRDLKNVRYSPDVIMSYDFKNEYMVNKTIGISVIDPSIHKGMKISKDEYIDLISSFCSYASSIGYSVILFSFCDRENDNIINNKIVEKNNDSNISICEYTGDIDSFILKFSRMEYIIDSRFHAMILGWYFKKRVLPFVYSDKHINVINDFNFLGSYLDLRERVKFNSKDIFDKLISNSVLEGVEDLKERANNQFKLLDNFLK